MPQKRPIRIDDLFKLKMPGRSAISPDGRFVAFELKRLDYDKNKNFVQIMLVEVDAAEIAGQSAAAGMTLSAGTRIASRAATARETGSASTSQAPRPLTSGDHVDVMPKWSPDGRRLAFISDRAKGRTLWILDMAGGEPRRITDRDGCVSDFAWSPDGRKIAFAYQPMTERDKLERDDRADDVKRMPQFKRITRLRHKLDGAGWWNGNYTHVFITDVERALRIADGGGNNTATARSDGPGEGRKAKQLTGADGLAKCAKQLTRGEFDDSEPRFSPDGRWVSFISNRLDDADLRLENADIYVVRPTGGGIKKIKQMNGACAGHSWSPDGRTIAYIGNPAKQGEWWKYNDHVWLVPASGGRSRELTSAVDNQCGNVTLGDTACGSFEPTAPLWNADGSRVYFLVSEFGATRLYSQAVPIDYATRPISRSAAKKGLRLEAGGEINIYSAQRSGFDGAIALTFGTNVEPADVYAFDPDHADASVARLTETNAAALKSMHVVQPEAFSVKSGNVTVCGWVIKPPNFDSRKKYPAILQIHGGPHGQYGYSMFHEMQYMAAKGYVVCFPNPRGSAGYGLKFMNCIHADWGNLDYQDVMKVGDWLFARPYVDRRRVGVTGGSYGGYMTNWVVGHSNRFAAAVTQRSVTNIESMFGTSDFGWDFGWEFGGKPWDKLAEYRRQSPITYVRNIRTPLLIEHEEQDHRCPIEQAEQLFTALKVLGREVEMVRFEGESHSLCRVGRPQNRAERLRVIVAWMDRYLGK